MKRPFQILLILLLFFTFLTSCNQGRIDELEQQLLETQVELEEVESKISEIQDNIDDLETSISDLRSEVDDFDYEDWSYNDIGIIKYRIY